MNDIVAFGEVLWDVIDGVPHIGGAPFNFAAHAVKCGLSAAIVSSVGDDELGLRARKLVHDTYNVEDCYLITHPTLPTGTVKVTLENGIPSYEIVEPVAWDEIAFPEESSRPTRCRAFYFGSLAQRSPISDATLKVLLETIEAEHIFFDVNLRQNYWSKELIEADLAYADILKVNDEEMKTLGFEAKALFAKYPRLKIVVETRGADGCAVWTQEGKLFTSPAVADGPVVDTVGAGDSFSAAFLASLLNGASVEEAARAGNIRAGKVAARAGAIPENL